MCHEKKTFGQSKTQNSDLADFLSRLRQKRHQELEMCLNLVISTFLAPFGILSLPRDPGIAGLFHFFIYHNALERPQHCWLVYFRVARKYGMTSSVVTGSLGVIRGHQELGKVTRENGARCDPWWCVIRGKYGSLCHTKCGTRKILTAHQGSSGLCRAVVLSHRG